MENLKKLYNEIKLNVVLRFGKLTSNFLVYLFGRVDQLDISALTIRLHFDLANYHLYLPNDKEILQGSASVKSSTCYFGKFKAWCTHHAYFCWSHQEWLMQHYSSLALLSIILSTQLLINFSDFFSDTNTQT